MAALSLHHPVLLENTTKQLSSALAASGPSSSQVCGILQSLALLRWTDGGEQGAAGSNLVRSCLSYLSDRQDTVSVREAAGVLTSLASLSVMPSSDAERAIVSGIMDFVLLVTTIGLTFFLASQLRSFDSHEISCALNPKAHSKAM